MGTAPCVSVCKCDSACTPVTKNAWSFVALRSAQTVVSRQYYRVICHTVELHKGPLVETSGHVKPHPLWPSMHLTSRTHHGRRPQACGQVARQQRPAHAACRRPLGDGAAGLRDTPGGLRPVTPCVTMTMLLLTLFGKLRGLRKGVQRSGDRDRRKRTPSPGS